MAADERDIQFLSLIFSLQAAALQQLGKLVHPMSGEVERDLAAARQSIDLLECLARKTQGNLSREEARALQDMLTTLRLNYVDELKKGEPAADPGADEAAPAEGDERASGESSD